MMERRTFIGQLAGCAAGSLPWFFCSNGVTTEQTRPKTGVPPRKRLAVITTVWRYGSHAWHMGERFLVGYPQRGNWHTPAFDVVAACVDQRGADDLSASRSREFGFPVYSTIAEALRCGTDKLAVDAVLVIGEHGDYPVNDIGQKQYPRYEFFKQVVDVFEQDGRCVPMFNDKHLSWKWDQAKEMVDTARKMKFPFLAGSSLPVTWRMPAIDMPYGSEIDEAMCVAMGGIDSYDFHALEVIQCMVERRRNGESGVEWVEAIRGDAVWRAMSKQNWISGGWSAELFQSCLARSQTLTQPETFSHRYPSVEQMRQWVQDPVAYRVQYRDGLRATMLLLNGLVRDFTFAARLNGTEESATTLSTLFHLPPTPNVTYSAALMAQAEHLFDTGMEPWPVERTLLTGGLVEAGVRSLSTGERLQTPWLDVSYTAPQQSLFSQH